MILLSMAKIGEEHFDHQQQVFHKLCDTELSIKLTKCHYFTKEIQYLGHVLSTTAVHHMNFWVHTAGTYRAMSILGRDHAAFFNYHQFSKMTHMPDEIALARIMTAPDLEFERALHYHVEGYESDNEYGLPTQVMRPICVYSVSTTEASFNPADYEGAHCPISSFTPR